MGVRGIEPLTATGIESSHAGTTATGRTELGGSQSPGGGSMNLETTYLANQFLIAMPSLADPNFARTVTYICEHDANGALGIIINRPLDLTLGQLLDHLEIEGATAEPVRASAVFSGGPVQPEQGFVLHTPPGAWEASLAITDTLSLTTSRDVLVGMADAKGPRRWLVALGYAGWGPGQLEQEMAENAWLSGPADPHVLFDLPIERRWEAAAALLGVDMRLISGDAGHA